MELRVVIALVLMVIILVSFAVGAVIFWKRRKAFKVRQKGQGKQSQRAGS